MLGRLFSRWIATTTANVSQEIEDKAKVAGLWALAGVLMVVAIAFATWLAYDELVELYGAKVTLSAIAGAFALLSISIMLWASYLARQDAKADTEGEPTAAAEASDSVPAPSNLQGSMDELIAILGSAGLRKEAVGLMAAKGVLGEVKPLQLVVLGLVAGFIVGRSG